MFKRKIYSKLLSWKEESNGNTALLIEGARELENLRLWNLLLRMNIKAIY